jgi:DNA-directed RNA polymerase I, II, and III subunit RPABC1
MNRSDFYRTVVTVNKMMKKREYQLSSSIFEYLNKEDFENNYSNQVNNGEFYHLIFQHKRTNKKIYVVWISEKVGNIVIKKILDTMRGLKISDCILIHENKITAYASATIKMLKNQGIFFEIFAIEFLIIDITEHKMVPEHSVCSKEEKEKLLEQYSATEDKLPKISINDPQVRYLGAKRKQLIKITRKMDSIPYMKLGEKQKDLYEYNYRLVV